MNITMMIIGALMSAGGIIGVVIAAQAVMKTNKEDNWGTVILSVLSILAIIAGVTLALTNSGLQLNYPIPP